MRHLDLFSGIGGFALAASWVWKKDYEPVVFCEIDKFCWKVLKKHWPNVPIIEDIKKLNGVEYAGTTALITAGFPCQDLSIAGKRKGLKGKQSGLFYELARIIEMVKPKWIILENVPGLLSVNNGKDMAEILNQLSEIGYCMAWRVLDAQYFGVAQRRKRVFFVGSFGNTSSVQVLFEQKSSRGNDKKKPEMGQKGLCISTRDGEKQDPTSETLIASTIRSNDHDTAGNTKPNNIIANTIGATTGGNSSFVWQDTHIAEINPAGKRAIDGISRELYIIEEIENGKMEFSRKQDSCRGRVLGNAIIPQIAEVIMRAIKEKEKIQQLKQNEEAKKAKEQNAT